MNRFSSANKVAPDEKIVPVMAYTHSYLCVGTIILKSQIRASLWLRGHLPPEFIRILDAKVIFTATPRDSISPIVLSDINLPVDDIIAFHVTPPARDPMDYDPLEINRRMVPVSVIAGSFIIEGSLRMAAQSNVPQYLETTREVYTSVYDVTIHSPFNPNLGQFQVPYILVRKNSVLFSSR